MLTMEKSVAFTSACANEIIPSIICSFVFKAKEGHHVTIQYNVPEMSAQVILLVRIPASFVSGLDLILSLGCWLL